MSAVIAALLLAAFVLLNRWSYNQFRRPNPADWTRRDSIAQLLIGVILLTMFAGPCVLLYFFQTVPETGFGMIEAILVVAVAAGTVYAYRALQRQWRGFLAEPPALSLVDGSGPGSAQPPRPGPGAGRKAA